MKTIFSALTISLAGILLTGLNASAGLIATTTYGGHTYELWADSGISWAAAEANAVAEGATLAALTDSAEASAVYGALINTDFFQGGGGGSQGVEAWLGGQTADGSGSTHNPLNWKWVTTEAWSAFDAGNFGGGEPNGDSSGLAINRFGTFQFNDESGRVGGYIVEKNFVPDGGMTVAMLGMSVTGLAYFRRKLS